MNKLKKAAFAAYFAFFVLLGTMKTASAYIDPATTSYLLQIVAGVFIAAGATVLIFWRKLTFWFKKKRAIRARKAKEKQGK